MKCEYCGKECMNSNSHKNHERRCPSNPDRNYTNGMKGKRGTNQYIKAKNLGLPKPEISEETRRKLSEGTSKQNITAFSNPEYREKICEAMRLAVKNNPLSYSSSNRGRTKIIHKYGIRFQGNWELEFYEWCLENLMEVVRVDEGFPYEWNGERTYFPDFYLPEFDLYVEVKGYETDRDRAKWVYFPHRLVIIRKSEIESIRKKSFRPSFAECS